VLVVWVVVVEVIESQPVLCVGVQCQFMLQVLLSVYQKLLWVVLLLSDREPDDQYEQSGLCVYTYVCVGFRQLLLIGIFGFSTDQTRFG